jgi:hypothetical protein
MRHFLFLLATSLFATCTPKEEERPLYVIEQSTKDYLVFPVGSYWIYEAENSNLQDSLYLYRDESGIIKKSKIVSYNYEWIRNYCYYSLNADTLIRGIDKSYESNLDVYGETSIKFFFNGNYTFFNRGICHDSVELTANNYLVRDCRDSVRVILGSTYRECIEFRDKYSGNVFVYSRGVGLIRKEEASGRIWNLKRYFINK